MYINNGVCSENLRRMLAIYKYNKKKEVNYSQVSINAMSRFVSNFEPLSGYNPVFSDLDNSIEINFSHLQGTKCQKRKTDKPID